MFKKKPKKVAVNNTTEEIAIEFLKRAVGSINSQLKIEIARLGFSELDIKKGRAELVRVVARAENDPRFVTESFSISSKETKTPRLIMAVKWTPSGFQIERYSDAMAEAIKRNPSFGVKKESGASMDLIHNATQRDVEVEAKAAEYVKQYRENLGKN